MENRCDFNPQRVNFWNDIYKLIKKPDYKIHVNFEWKSFKERKFPVVGAVHIDNLASLKNDLSVHDLPVMDIDTLHYRGIYFEISPECAGLFIALKKDTDTWKQDLDELREFGKKNRIDRLSRLDGLSGELLLKNIEYLLIDMVGFSHGDFMEMQSESTNFGPLKSAFWCEIYSRIKLSSLKVYIDFDWRTFEKRKIPVIGVVKLENSKSLKKQLAALKLKTRYIENIHYSILYFESTADLCGLFISPKYEMMEMDQRIINSDLEFIILEEIKKAGMKNKIESLADIDMVSCVLIKRFFETMMEEILKITEFEINGIIYKNSHSEYIRNYLDLKNKRYVCKHKDILFDHIEKFSGLYYLEIKIISELLRGGGISIHDVGTNVAQFPLLLSALSGEELFGVNITSIIASDCAWTGEIFIKDILKDNPGYKKIDFIKLDLIGGIKDSPETDVVIANDVLEHLPDDDTSFAVLKGLWDKTGKLLIVHVPFEKIPSPFWGHNISFNDEKIKNWAGRLPDGNILPGRFYESEMQRLIGGVFLVVSREDFSKLKEKKEMEKRCDFNPQKINFWNDTYNLIKRKDYKVYTSFDWKTFKKRRFPVIGALQMDNLDELKMCIENSHRDVKEIRTLHYRGIYFETSPECAGMFIALRKDTDTWRQDFDELRAFGEENNIENLALIDDLSWSLLLTNIGFLLYDTAGIFNQDFMEIQSVGDIDPSKIIFWYKICGIIKEVNPGLEHSVIIDAYWETFQARKIPVIGTVHIDDLDELKKGMSLTLEARDIMTPHYRGIYFETSPECAGLFIALRKDTDTWRQDLDELRTFGKDNNIESLELMDGISCGILLNNIEFMMSGMAGINHKDFVEMQLEHNFYNPLRTNFWCNTYSLIIRDKFRVYMDFDWRTFEKRKFPVIGSVKLDGLEPLKNRLLEHEFKTTVIETTNYLILYFESGADPPGLFISLKNELPDINLRNINSDIEYSIMSELKKAGRKHLLENLSGLDFLSSSLIKRCFESLIADILGITVHEMRVITYKNSHMKYVGNYRNYKNRGAGSLDYISRKSNMIREENIKWFSGIYYLEIRQISKILKGPAISIHDVGTNVAQFPLLLSALSREELFGLEISRIIASDIGWTGEEYIKEIINHDESYKPISFIKLDLIEDIQNFPATDVIIANDVLEHMPDEEASFSVLKGLWEKTGKLLIAHVPIEDSPNLLWDHHVAFNEEKIRKWAGRLAGGCDRQELSRYGLFVVPKFKQG